MEGEGEVASDVPGPRGTRREQALRSLGLLVAAIAVVLVGGLGAGYLYAKGSPEQAAGSLVGQFVVAEPDVGAVRPARGDPAPTSGTHEGSARCGRASSPVTADDQLATLATGAVVVQYHPDDVRDLELLDELAGRDDVLVAPNPDLDAAVVATAWARRMTLPDATPELLFAFVTAHRGIGPDASARCLRLDGQ